MRRRSGATVATARRYPDGHPRTLDQVIRLFCRPLGTGIRARSEISWTRCDRGAGAFVRRSRGSSRAVPLLRNPAWRASSQGSAREEGASGMVGGLLRGLPGEAAIEPRLPLLRNRAWRTKVESLACSLSSCASRTCGVRAGRRCHRSAALRRGRDAQPDRVRARRGGALHSRPHEQLGIVLRGMQRSLSTASRASSGRSRVRPSRRRRALRLLRPEGALVLDVFRPVRDDYKERWEAGA